ncbi:nuclear transport factor 2 family protein [Streptacidiphilus sp. P02-A3a]|uniref:nuclear transport factor 2 family protein n=1 Tax=Streptacidiphilus sp. P02-A3a TaxID=2704468 RepID=UPI0015F83472|nr:nuclear transport factor 2 family protein [Streptacidiphilus sp. P02-A3a]QMU69644.1 nuclear transport factor 2 family protein [Streptacidiphilus sp. P02-A3a]
MTSIGSLADRLAVGEVVARLAAAQDACDWAGLRLLLADRVGLDLSRHLGVPAGEISAEDFVDRARSVAGGFTATHHLTANLVVDLEADADRASCRAHVLAHHHLRDAPDPHDAVCVMHGTWDLLLRRTGTRWLVEELTVARTAPLEGNADLYTRTATGGRL